MSTPLSISPLKRAADVRAGVNVEIITVVWMIVEAAIAIAAGLVARSVLLTAFGLDSVIELVSGGALLWRLTVEAQRGSLERVERAENRAAWVTGIALVLLCVYIVATSILSLLAHAKPEGSLVGIGLAIAALIIMPWLVWRKRSIAAKINSSALRGDAACSLTCAQMAGALLVGVALNTLFGWWWADAVAALALLFWIAPEAREALEGLEVGEAVAGVAMKDASCDGVDTNSLTLFGALAVTAMLVFYALEGRSPRFVLAFAGACLASSVYGFLQGAYPFGVVELVWSGVALRRWWIRRAIRVPRDP